MSRWPLVMALVTMGCGGGAVDEPCGPATCDGCCAASGHCVSSCGGGCADGSCLPPPRVTPDAGRGWRDGGLDASTPAAHDAGTDDGGAADAGRADAGVDAGTDAGRPCAQPPLVPANVAVDGDFECGSTPSFQSSGGGGRVDFVAGRSGRALRFTVAAGLFNNEFASTWRFEVRRAGTWCARAFVRGTASAVSLRLYLGPPGTAAGQMFDMPGPWPTWSRLPPTLTAVHVTGQVGDEGLLVFSDTSHTVGATIEVDDVDVWRSDDGACRER